MEDNTYLSPLRQVPGPRSQSFLKVTIILKLRYKISLLGKQIFKSYSEPKFLHGHTEEYLRSHNKKKYELSFGFELSYVFIHKNLDIKVKVVLEFKE